MSVRVFVCAVCVVCVCCLCVYVCSLCVCLEEKRERRVGSDLCPSLI